MRARKPGSTQSMVRGVIKAAGRPVRPAEVRDLIGLSGDKGYARVSRSVKDLMRSGEIERYAPGRYVWKGAIPAAKAAPLQNTVWRFAQIRTRRNKPFTLKDAHEMTGVTMDTAKKYITFLKKNGYLVQVGQKKNRTSPAPMYLLAAEHVNGPGPRMRKNRRAAEIEASMDEIRRLAMALIRMPDTRLETIQAMAGVCEEIKAALWGLRVIKAGRRLKADD